MHAFRSLLLLLALLALLAAGERDADAVEEVVDATLSAALTGCGLCQQTGLCDHAFKGNPGQFCLTLASGAPCCCPQDAQCVANVYSCRCRRSSVTVVKHTSSTTTEGTKSVSLFSLMAMLLCATCCLCAVCKRNQDVESGHFAQPVYVSSQYGTADEGPAKYGYGYPSAPSAPYEAPYATPAAEGSQGYGNAVATGALGAVAGLAGGYLLGSAFGGGGRETETTTTTTTYFGGDAGFDNSTDTYEFAGDSGDYGGDFGGDS